MSLLTGFALSKGAKPPPPKAKPPTTAEMQDWIAKAERGEKF